MEYKGRATESLRKILRDSKGGMMDIVWGPEIEFPTGNVAMITGVTGQDGSYLAELLLNKGYEVIGIARRSSVDTTSRIKHLVSHPNFQIIEGDVTDPHNVNYWLNTYTPQEFYNLAAQSHVATSFNQPNLTWKVNAEGVINILEAIRHCSPHTRFYQASTSEMFGRNYSTRHNFNNEQEWLRLDPKDRYINYQDENTPFAPQSPYAIAKAAAHHAVQLYRRAYNIHASCGILFNHESERRGEEFVTRKITKWIGEFKRWFDNTEGTFELGNIGPYENRSNDLIYDSVNNSFPKLRLGNLDAKRDWGHAEDYVEAMWLMLQQINPGDYVISTGETHTVREFLDLAFKQIGIEDWTNYIVIDPKFVRPAEVDFLLGDSSNARKKLGWEPKVGFETLVNRMVNNDK